MLGINSTGYLHIGKGQWGISVINPASIADDDKLMDLSGQWNRWREMWHLIPAIGLLPWTLPISRSALWQSWGWRGEDLVMMKSYRPAVKPELFYQKNCIDKAFCLGSCPSSPLYGTHLGHFTRGSPLTGQIRDKPTSWHYWGLKPLHIHPTGDTLARKQT